MLQHPSDTFAIPPAVAPAPAVRRGEGPLRLVVGVALLVGLLNRLLVGWDAPLWLDESFSAVIATQKDGAHLLEWMMHELSGPVYYAPLWLWQQLAGDSNMALRIPSFLSSIAAPLLILACGPADRRMRLVWAALAALWAQGFDQATEARPYALLTLLGTAQTMAFARLLLAPSTRRAALWIAVCGLGILTHYYVIVIAGVQGLLYLASSPRVALRTWPATLVLLPVFGWMSIHLPFVLAYASGGGTWYSYLNPASLRYLPDALLGFWPLSDAFVIGMAGTALILGARHVAARRPMTPPTRANALTVVSGLVAIGIVLVWALFNRSFTPRYLVPFVPPLLFGLAWWLAWIDQRVRHVATIVLALLAGLGFALLSERIAHAQEDRRYALNAERPTQWLIAHKATARFLYFWDNPTSDISADDHMTEVAGYFFRRAGLHPQVVIPHMSRDADPNVALLRAAGTAPGTGLLWFYDSKVPFTRGIRHPARIAQVDPRWTCRNFGRDRFTVLACARR